MKNFKRYSKDMESVLRKNKNHDIHQDRYCISREICFCRIV